MDFSKYSGMELIEIYGELLSKMREDKLIRSKNVTGDLGEYIVVDYYTKTKGLPKLQFAPPSTKNIDAISVNGERYSIKCITTNTTGAFYGIEKNTDISDIKPLFEYVVIIKLNENTSRSSYWNLTGKHFSNINIGIQELALTTY